MDKKQEFRNIMKCKFYDYMDALNGYDARDRMTDYYYEYCILMQTYCKIFKLDFNKNIVRLGNRWTNEWRRKNG